MYSLSNNPEDNYRRLWIGYEAISIANEKIFDRCQTYEERIKELEDRLINHFNDSKTVRTVFERGPISWKEFLAKNPGKNHEELWLDYSEEIKKLTK